MSHVLIVFQTNNEPVEQLALAVAVGAVEAEALIRLRRPTAPGSPEVGHKSYGKLAAPDLVWADAVIVGLEDPAPIGVEVGVLVDLLDEFGVAKLASAPKRALTFNAEGLASSPTQAELLIEKALVSAGFEILAKPNLASSNLLEQMKQLGRAAAFSTT